MTNQRFQTSLMYVSVALSLVAGASCTNPSQGRDGETVRSAAPSEEPASQAVSLKKIPTGKQFSGFLKDYSNLKPNPNLDGDALTFVRSDPNKNVHKYIAFIVDPVQVYLASDADASKLPQKGPGAGASYFHKALVDAVSSAFPIVDQPGPLVLRLRSAIVGVDVGSEIPTADGASDAFRRAVNIGKVCVEMELVDSETGEQIAAMVDRANLGAGAEIGSANFSREEKWAAARDAFDEWGRRVREFLDSAHELSVEDAKRADQSYRPYGEEPVRR